MVGAELGVVVCILGALGVLAVAWWACGRMPRAPAWAARALLLVLVLPYALQMPEHLRERGSWLCELCGQVERHKSFAGVVLEREPWGDPEAREAIDAYVAWIEPLLGAHEHAWIRVGCHFRANRVSCTMLDPLTGWCQHLPGMDDQELSRRVARAYLAADSDQRRQWMSSAPGDREEFARWLTDTFP